MGGDTVIQQPQTPAPPTAGQNMADYVAGLPAMYQAQMEWNPKLAQQQLDLTTQYAPQYSELMKNTNESLYPGITSMNEKLTQQAMSGMDAAVPEAMRAQYLDSLRSEIGGNAGSGIGADYVSRGLVNQNEQYKQYYQNMALSLTGRQPLTQAQSPQFNDVGSGYNYGQVANNNMQGYGNYAGLYGSMYGSNQQAQSELTKAQYGLIGSGIGAAGTMFCWVASEVFDETLLGERVSAARRFILDEMPMWFVNGYRKYGERIAAFIHDKPILKNMIRPLFAYFAKKGGYRG
jgi:hypothetical protein